MEVPQMKITDELKSEHEGIRIMLNVLDAVKHNFQRGQAVDTDDLAGILEFMSVFIDKCHHAKEEEFLFPALEATGMSADSGLIGEMLSEHRQGRELYDRFNSAVTRYSSGDQSAANDIRTCIDAYVALLRRHIDTENNDLFPLAEARLDAKTDSELFEAFERLETERIGAGKHDEFHVLLHRLDQAYLA
jgi:hemerythrin-like domain-containing protein